MRSCILYGRVSSSRQAETFSLPTQFRELRAWAEREGYRVVEETADRGGKNSKRDVFDRPGIERIFDLCESQRVDVVVAQERSRFGEYPVPDMIAFRLAQYGTALKTPDDSGEGKAGELMAMFQDWNSRQERRTTARRSRSRKLEQARSGFVVPSHTPIYGFKVAGERTRRVYEVEEPHMAVVRRIFEMVGMEGLGNRTVARILNSEGVSTPPAPIKKKRLERGWGWRHQFVRKCVLNDAYRPHTPEELAVLVEQGMMTPKVAAEAPEGCGVWWYAGRDFEGQDHRVAVPVPHSGVSREVADAARAAVVDNAPLSGAGNGRLWELLGGILRCGGCGMRMQAHAVRSRGRTYHYMRCPLNQRTTLEECPVNAKLHAERSEGAVWRFVAQILSEPQIMIDSVDQLIVQERARPRDDSEAVVRELQDRLGRLSTRRAAYQDQQAAGHMTFEELGDRLRQVEESREAVKREIDANEHRSKRLRDLMQYRDVLVKRVGLWNGRSEEYSDLEGCIIGSMPWHNDAFAPVSREQSARVTPEQRQQHYRELELRVVAHSKEELEVSGIFGTELIYT